MNNMRKEILQAALEPPRLGSDAAEQSFCFATDFLGFAGHFPGYPILPAVIQTLLGQILAEQLFGQPLRFLSLERAKFVRQLRPEERIDVSLSCSEKSGQLHCATKLQVAGQPAASFTLILHKGPQQ